MWPFETVAWYLRPKGILEECPSLKAGLGEQKVRQNRLEACEFIAKVSRRLNLYYSPKPYPLSNSPFRTMASAQLYFHLFFTKYAMNEYPHMDIALTALLVASKAEETYKKIRQILAAAFLTLNPTFSGTDLDVKIVEEHRARVTQYEHTLLEAIEFNFVIRHAHEVLARLCKTLRIVEKDASEAFAFCQQCYRSPVILCFPPEHIALAGILKSEEKKSRRIEGWASKHNVNLTDLNQLIQLVSSSSSSSSPPSDAEIKTET